MKIAVCVKYVPVVAHIGFDTAIKTMIREGVPSEINPFDRLGVVCAIALKADPADQVLALSMGPPQAQEGLVHCLALGADRAVLLTDRALAGSDTLATARAWRSCWPKNGRMELFAVATAQTPKRGRLDEIAELLGLPLPPWQRPKSPCWRSTTRQMETPAGGEAPRGETFTARVGVHTGWVAVGSSRDETPRCRSAPRCPLLSSYTGPWG